MFKTEGIAYDNYTTFERNGIVLPPKGTVIYNSDTSTLEKQDGAPGLPIWNPIGGGVDTNTWDISQVAFVDPSTGNNTTAVNGDGNKPWATISSAIASGARKILLLPGQYTSITYIQYDDVEMHAMTGVEFTREIQLFNSSIVNFRLTGHAIFTNTINKVFVIQSMAPLTEGLGADTYGNIEFHFDHADNTGRLLFCEQDSMGPRINFSCNWVITTGQHSAYSVRVVGGTELRMDIKYFFHSQYVLYHMRNSATGKLIVNCPDSRLLEEFLPLYGNINKSVVWLDSLNGAYVEINGDINNDIAAYLGQSTFIAQSLYQSPAKIVINGNINAVNNFCFLSSYRGVNGEFEFNGNMTSGYLCFNDQLTGWSSPANQIYVFNGSIMDGLYHNIVGRGRTFYFKDCSFISREDGTTNVNAANIFVGLEPGSPVSQTYLYFYNCIMESGFPSDPATETFHDFSANFNIGTINTVSNIQIGAGLGAVDDWGNFVVNPLLVTPKIR